MCVIFTCFLYNKHLTALFSGVLLIYLFYPVNVRALFCPSLSCENGECANTRPWHSTVAPFVRCSSCILLFTVKSPHIYSYFSDLDNSRLSLDSLIHWGADRVWFLPFFVGTEGCCWDFVLPLTRDRRSSECLLVPICNGCGWMYMRVMQRKLLFYFRLGA